MHEVESMFYVRDVPWHGIGVRVEHAPDSETAISLAGLNWRVKQVPIIVNSHQVDGYVANVRDTDNRVLGIVSSRFRVVQNEEAFMFTNELVGKEGEYDTAGSLRDGKRVFICMKLYQDKKVLGDEFATYLVFSNGHDGSFGVHVNITPVRVVCMNTLHLALNSAKRSFTVNHTGSVINKVYDAMNTLKFTEKYIEEFTKKAEELASTKLTAGQIQNIVEKLIPEKQHEVIYTMLNADDLVDFRNTAWGLINAVSDFASHRPALRNTRTFNETKMIQSVYHPLIDKAQKMVLDL